MNRSSPAQGATEKAASVFAFGLRLDQADTLDRLAQTIAAHGDVIAVGNAAQCDPRTLPHSGLQSTRPPLRCAVSCIRWPSRRSEPLAIGDCGRALYALGSYGST